MNRLTSFVAAFSILLLVSCKKEYSVENGYDPNNPPLGNNCRVSTIVQADSATGIGLGSYATTFDANFLATRLEVYDSLQGTSLYNISFSRTGDTLRVNANEFFVLGSNKRALSFHSRLDPADPNSPSIEYVYTYDGSGYMTKKELFQSGIPIPAVRFEYTWANGNLQSVEGNIIVPGQEAKLFSATMQYDLTRTIKNFIPLFPDGYEHFLYDMAVDLGTNSRNPLTRMEATYYDGAGNVTATVTNLFTGHVYSVDGYLKEWYVVGDAPIISTLAPGMNKFKYTCK